MTGPCASRDEQILKDPRNKGNRYFGSGVTVKGTEVTQWTREADGASIVKEDDPKGIWTLDELDELVSSRILSRGLRSDLHPGRLTVRI